MRQRDLRRTAAMGLLAAALLMAATAGAGSALLSLPDRWLYVQTNLLVDQNVTGTVALIDRAAKAGYNGLALADSKFMMWDKQPERYAANARAVREACRRSGLSFIACVFPIGWSNSLLSRDVNLAEGLPVVDAPFVVRQGRLEPADDPIAIVNGGFEQFQGNTPSGWRFVDQPGRIAFIDTEVKHEGRASLRMQDIAAYDPQHRHGRAHQPLKVRPFTSYHVSVAVKTQDFEAADEIRVQVLAADGASLSYHRPRMRPTQDWSPIHLVFNSLEHSQVDFYLGVWGGKGGKLWWDDARIEPAGLVNILRREGTPLRVRSEDGLTAYEEGRDFDGARDPRLGNARWAGDYDAWHQPPLMTVPAGSRLRERQRVLVSYYQPALIYDGAVMCCMAEPALYDILEWQVREVRKHLEPDGYFMQHDEIRVQGWDESCQRTGATPAQLLARNVSRCAEIIVRTDPGKPIYVWSDMFDPYHNASPKDRYYLVKGDGPWYGSWQGLPREVVVLNWHGHDNGRLESLKHFAELGHRQILAGYYDADPRRILAWLDDARGVPGVTGVMYTTWQQNYADLETFALLVDGAVGNVPGR